MENTAPIDDPVWIESNGTSEISLNEQEADMSSEISEDHNDACDIPDTPVPKVAKTDWTERISSDPPAPTTESCATCSDGGMFSILKAEKDNKIKSRYAMFQPTPPSLPKTAPTTDSSEYYKMDTFPRGELILLNNKNFEKRTGMADHRRDGTDEDATALVDLFVELGFVVHRYDDVNKHEMKQILKVMACKMYSDKSCFFCAILSHGEEGTVYATDGDIQIRELTSLFQKSTTAGIPKVFLIQACQGSEVMESVDVQRDAVDGKPFLFSRSSNKVSLPVEADFLYVYSTVAGFYSWRHSRNGSWFIQTLCEVFRLYAHKMDIVRMLTRVNRVVAERKSCTMDKETDGKRQICSIVSQLRKEFFFFPPDGPLKPRDKLV